MLVVHPKDRTTSVFSILYEGMDANMVSNNCSNKKMEHLLHNVSTQERIMLLGHGSDKGLSIERMTLRMNLTKSLLDTHTVSICASMVVI
mgnify:CR=1 FL=1